MQLKPEEIREPIEVNESIPACSSSKVVTASTSTMANSSVVSKVVLMATANVVALNSYGSSVTIRTFIDPTAERSFISNRLASLLAFSPFIRHLNCLYLRSS